jgi:hypothetical protein
MSELLRRMSISAASDEWISPGISLPLDLTTVDGSVFLKHEHDKSRHVTLSQFPDRSGYESFVNHRHLPFDGRPESLLCCLSYASAIKRGLARLADGRRFQIVVSVSDDCMVRFHEIRPGENLMAEDLESYADEAILLLCAGSA